MAAAGPPPRLREESAAVRQVLAGDRNAYALLVERYGAPLFRYLVRMTGQPQDAEDLVQEAFLRAYLSLASYDDCYRFSTWLYRIATNLAVNRLQAGRRIVPFDRFRHDAAHGDDRDPPEPPDPDEARRPDLALERTQRLETIQRCLDELPDTYRSVVTLRHLAGLSYGEISGCVGLPLNTVRSRLHRGRERLGECLAGRLPQEERP
jgi:RNA polymerase sigma-70 factor (ECF subfamily)